MSKHSKPPTAKEAVLQYPDYNKPFHIYADASDCELGLVIMQERKPVAFFSLKLDSEQGNYTTGETELLSIVETLKESNVTLQLSSYTCVYRPQKPDLQQPSDTNGDEMETFH